jgi:uroporphyrinogen decarboxylase
MNPRENSLRAIRFERPDTIPMSFHINGACWHHYDPDTLQELMAAHPLLFPNFMRQAVVTPVLALNQWRDAPYTDPWGCRWETTEDGITGSVHGHPLADWRDFTGYRAPDPDTTDGTYPVDWNRVQEQVGCQKANGELVCGGLPHGHTFLRLQDLRGYENLIFDMLDEPPQFQALVDLVEAFNARYVGKWLELKPDLMSYPEDLGMQVGPMLSPDLFRRFIKPVYQRLMKPARDQGCIVHMHSDGDLRTIIPDLVEGGVEVVNLQDLVNGIDWIAGTLAGRICIDLDIDRQQITARGTPRQIEALIREEVAKLGSRQGGLMMIYGLYPGVPLENVRAVMDAMERYAAYYA